MAGMRFRRCAVLVLAMLAAAAARAAPATACSASSGARTTALIELYTSEGCSSCPPAERWLAGFGRDAGDAKAIALAFHVDYWDRLGWKDRFASARFTDRQYEAMRANRGRFVYTPQVLIQGRDFPGWQRAARAQEAIAAINARPARASIALAARSGRGGIEVRARASVADPGDRPDAKLFVALVDSGLVSEVTAGENRGERLAHEHVVRAFAAGASGGEIALDTTLPLPGEAGSARSVVAFVQRSEGGEVLQALALPLSGPGCLN